MYYQRLIDVHLSEWASRYTHKPVLLRGARQVGKSTAVRQLGKQFENYVEINFEKNPEYKQLFQNNLDVNRIVPLVGAMSGTKIIPSKTLLFSTKYKHAQKLSCRFVFSKKICPNCM